VVGYPFMLGRPFQTKGQLPHVNGSRYNGTTAHLSCAMLPQLEAFFAPFLACGATRATRVFLYELQAEFLPSRDPSPAQGLFGRSVDGKSAHNAPASVGRSVRDPRT